MDMLEDLFDENGDVIDHLDHRKAMRQLAFSLYLCHIKSHESEALVDDFFSQ